MSPETLWAAHKVTVRGKIIQIAARLKRMRKLVVEKLEETYVDLSRKHKLDPSEFPTSKLDSARTALNLALTVRADEAMKWTGARFYRLKDRIGPMLANKLSPRFRSRILPKIRQADGSFTLNPRRIMTAFQNFYSKLYAFDGDYASDKVEKFLDGLDLPKLTETHREEMEATI